MIRLFFIFARIGLLTYGGGLASLPFLYQTFVLENGWMTAGAFAEVTALAQMTPGPIVLNAATMLGWRFGGMWGSIACSAGVVAAPLLVVGALMWVIRTASGKAALWVDRVRMAMRPVVAAMLVASLWSIARPVAGRPVLWPLTLLAACLWWKSAFIRSYPQVMLFACALAALAASFTPLAKFF